MADDRAFNQQPQPDMGNEEESGRERTEQFNELSEISLEERMAVADQIGVPVRNAGEAAATGTISGSDDAATGSDDEIFEQKTKEETNR